MGCFFRRRRNITCRSLLEKIGGEAALEEAVDTFCERVLADAYLVSFFTGVNVGQFKGHQLMFMKVALGEKQSQALYAPRTHTQHIYEKHRKFFELGMNETHFDVVCQHMSETLHNLHVKKKYIDEIYTTVLLPYRDMFVERDINSVQHTWPGDLATNNDKQEEQCQPTAVQ